jgi:glutamine synthetase
MAVGVGRSRQDEEAVARRVRELSDAGVEAVMLAMVDNAGVTRTKAIPLRRFPEAVAYGIGLSTVFSVFLVDDDITSAPGVEGPSGDMRLIPDPDATTALAAMPGWAISPVDQYTQEGEVWAACSRSFLKRQVATLANHGLELRGAFELEFFLGLRGELPPGLGEEPDPVPAHAGPGYSAGVLTRHEAFGLGLVRSLETQGTGIEQFHPEYSTGQFEVSVPHRSGVEIADTNLVVRQTIRAAARAHGIDVSFAPVVFPDLVGNGCHLHFSLWDREGRNLFASGTATEGMTREAEAFCAGLVAHLPGLVAVTAPSAASYLRLQPHKWAGAFVAWGRENREAALRFVTGMVGSRDAAANMELKPVDAAGNPYLVLGSVIAGGISGLEQELSLPEPTTEDPSEVPEDRREAMGIRPLPRSLREAIEELERATVLRRAMGELLFESFLATRRGELKAFEDLDPEAIIRAHRWRY